MAKKSAKLDYGSIYQKTDGGTFYFRFQVNGQRKAVSLKTCDFNKAKKEAKKYIPVVNAPSMEVVAAHVSHASFGVVKKILKMGDAWAVYEEHPDRATPTTVSEQSSYMATWRDFVSFMGKNTPLGDVTPEDAGKYASKLRKQKIAVDTHNRKIRRLKKIFDTLKEYRVAENPFNGRALQRKGREDHDSSTRRRSFSREQVADLLKALDDDENTVVNKAEIRVLYHLGIYTGQRLKDCALLKWDKVNFERKRIWVKQFKTGKEVTIPIAPQLLDALRQAKSWERNDFVLPAVAKRYQKKDKNGRVVGADLVNKDVLRVIRWIGLEPSVKVKGLKRKVTVYGFHSLRHSFASHCAEAGVPKAVVLSILGAASEIVDKHYVHIGEEAQLQALDALNFGEDTQESPQDKISRTIEYIDGLPSLTKELEEIKKLLT